MADFEQVRVSATWRMVGGWMLGLAFAVTATACGDDEQGPTSCTADSQCQTGYVCSDSKCAQIPCGSVVDCLNNDQACIPVNGGNYCSAIECGCSTCSPCAVGEECVGGFCAAPTTCGPTNPCSGTNICDSGTCRPCQGTECGQTDCTVTGCSNGQQCNTTTKQCEAVTVTADVCDACTNAEECGAGWKCVPLPTGQACLPPCGSNDECDTGWSCVTGVCRPGSSRCEKCAIDGCPAGKACNPGNSECIDATPNCGSCGNDWECGDGNACLNNTCQQRCDNNVCPSGGACVNTPGGVSVCDKNCASQCTPACSGVTPHCNNGTCVQCRTNTDCQNGQTCDTGSGLCTGTAQCSGQTPILWQGRCVECVTSNDCSGGLACSTNNTCTSSRCATCAAPYPACVTIGTDSYCVQCATDADCGLGGTCDTTSYACQGGTVTPAEKCTSDADCDSGTSSGFSLRCHQQTGYCYDEGGMCDDVTAFCVGSTGQIDKCVSMFELFGMGGGIPGMPGGSGTIPGFCGCTCTIPGLCIGPGSCRVGNCADFGALFGLPGSQPFCLTGF